MPDPVREFAPPPPAAPPPYAPPPYAPPSGRAADDGPFAPPATGAAAVRDFVASLRRHRRLILGIALPAALVVALLRLSRPREFASASAFIPQTKSQGSAISALAAQYGVTLGGGGSQESPGFYVDLLTSSAILGQLVDTPVVGARGGRTTLADVYGVPAKTAAKRREETVKTLRRHVSVALVPRSGIIRVQVATPDSVVSQQVNRSLLALTNDFNLNTRRSQAKAERQFAEERLARVRDDLRAAEDRLEAFYRGNRVYESSPSLTFAQTRLTREMELQRQLNATLTQQLEQAKLDEVRDTPVITILEQPDLPLGPEPRGTLRLTLLALIGGGVVGVLLGLLQDTLRQAAGASPAGPV